jgi:mannose-6-phosphate isomerase
MADRLYPLTFHPLFKSMLWGGRRLPAFLGRPAPHGDPIGEAWVLSDVEGNASVVAHGPLAGRTLRELLAERRRDVLGSADAPDGRFPLLLKFIDARQELSVQVHPDDELAVKLAGPGKRGKTEAWVILDRDPATSRIYAGFRPGVTAGDFREAMAAKTAPKTLHSFTPTPGDCVFLKAGTVHAIGADILLFEVQQTSDITYRLYDWDRIDAKTGRGRELHIDHGLTCSDFAKGPCHPVTPKPNGELVNCEYFTLHRHARHDKFMVGADGACRVVVRVEGQGDLVWNGERHPIGVGSVVLLPAAVGIATIDPRGPMTVLECGLPVHD